MRPEGGARPLPALEKREDIAALLQEEGMRVGAELGVQVRGSRGGRHGLAAFLACAWG